MSGFQEIRTYIPQSDPIVMVSELCKANDTEVVSKLFVSDENIFSKEGKLDESGIIENIAQTAAAMTGYNAITNNSEVKKGFIGSINNLIIHNLPKTNLEIETKVSIENTVMNVHIIKGFVKQNNELMAECEMKIFLEE